MEPTERCVALVIYPSTPAAQFGQADTLLRMAEDAVAHFRQSEFGRAAVQVAGELHPKAYWMQPHSTVTAP